ncbi:uncharacterized protein LOC131601093 isoform X1 [Vicia villosa]|uniref:uncharacterized protein LOC131601093 isoform X1 n=1 Tax=Vicia villosa TaxID=3911 RepID=UPI00273BD5B3|nr:uncharacterized protein LOC131601093 isoform X1 [Vicia villosa]
MFYSNSIQPMPAYMFYSNSIQPMPVCAVPQALGEFLREVEVAFHDDRDKYDQFCKLWQDIQFSRIPFLVFEAKLKSLFQGHKYLILEFNKLVPKHASQFIEAVKVALKDDYHAFIKVFQDYRTFKDDYHDFIKVFEDYRTRKIDERCLSSRVKELLREHALLISQTKPPWDELTFDVLSVISQKLDFDDLFQFSRVCANWRLFHKSIDKSKFLISQEPLLVELPYSFTSLPKQKVYPLNKMMMNMLSYSHYPSFPIYVTCSCGYFIIIADNSSLLLINPFRRIKKKVICPSTFESFSYQHKYHALLDFDKDSEEFVLVFLFYASNSLHVYQSRNNGWVTCSTDYPQDIYYFDDDFVNLISDFVALNNIIYVVSFQARIGVLNLSSANIEFFKMANSLELELARSWFNLVKCDEQLFLVRLYRHLTGGSPPPDRKVFKIDFSTMTYVELETLGDIALFYVCFNSCKALSNPNKWGYESNSVYEVCSHPNHQTPNCTVYNWDKKSLKYIAPPNLKTKGGSLDWYFII